MKDLNKLIEKQNYQVLFIVSNLFILVKNIKSPIEILKKVKLVIWWLFISIFYLFLDR